MINRDRALNTNPQDKGSSLKDLARDIIGIEDDVAASTASPLTEFSTDVTIALEDLISDDNGEIVFFNDSGFRTLSITTQSSVVSNGQANDHSTMGGEDVSGFKYVTFDNGVTLYFEEGLDLLLSQG